MNSELIFIIEFHVKQIKNHFKSIKLLIFFEDKEETLSISSLFLSYSCYCQLIYEKTFRNQLFFGLKVNIMALALV